MVQSLVFLRFVGTGAFQQLVGVSIHISKSSTMICIRKVALAFADLTDHLIRFPTGQEAVNTKWKHHGIAGTLAIFDYIIM